MAERQLAYSLMSTSSVNDKLLLEQLTKFAKGQGDQDVMLEVVDASVAYFVVDVRLGMTFWF